LKCYPKAKVDGKLIPVTTGCFEVILNKGTAKENKVHSKLGGDGKVNESNVDAFLVKFKKAVESS